MCFTKWKNYIESNCKSENPALLQNLLDWLAASGNKISLSIICILFGLLCFSGVGYYNIVFSEKEITVFSFLWLALSVFWFIKGKEFDSYLANIIAQLCIAGFFALIRRQLNLTTDFWRIEYDIWCSLAVTCVLAGVKQIIFKQNKTLLTSFILTLCVLPAFAMIWTIIHNLGVNMTLLVIGLNSMIFGYYGKDEKDSPFNLVAVIGFVVFTVILFWTKLELRVLHAFVIPISIGILVLSQLFKKSLMPDTLSVIRFISIGSMVGCSGYYALIDPKHPIAFNFTMIIICLAIMFAGSFFKIKSYLIIGFGGLIIDVFSIFYKIITRLDRTYKMTTMGVLLLIIGISLVIGAAYYKTNKNRIDELIDKFRNILKSWE